MFMLHLLEFLLFSVVHTGPIVTTSKIQMDWFESVHYCKSTSVKNELNAGNDWLSGLVLQTPWMVYRGCFAYGQSWDVSSIQRIERNITSSCSYKCRQSTFFALRSNSCACLTSLLNMVELKNDDCNLVCIGSQNDPCGDRTLCTVYEHKDFKSVENNVVNNFDVELCSSKISNITDIENMNIMQNGTKYYRRQAIKWKTNNNYETCTEIVICLSENDSFQDVSLSCYQIYSALCESNSERDINGMKDLSTNQQSMTVISYASTTASPGTKTLVPANMIRVTDIAVVGGLITIVMVVIVILILLKRKRKRTEFNSRKSVITTNCYDMSWSGEGEQTMQMLSNRSNNRTNAVPSIRQQTQSPGNISASNYQDPVDMDNQYKRLDFTIRSDLKEVHNDYAMQFYKRTFSPAVNDDGSKRLKKVGLTKGTKEVYNNYSLPYDSLSHPPAVNIDDTKLQIKAGPSVMTEDEGHGNGHVAYCHAAIVHEKFLYDIPKHSSKSLVNRCSVKK